MWRPIDRDRRSITAIDRRNHAKNAIANGGAPAGQRNGENAYDDSFVFRCGANLEKAHTHTPAIRAPIGGGDRPLRRSDDDDAARNLVQLPIFDGIFARSESPAQVAIVPNAISSWLLIDFPSVCACV